MAKYDLQGIDGNVFNIIGYVTQAMRREHYSREEIIKFRETAILGDYDFLLCAALEKIDEINKKVEEQEHE